MLSPGSYVLSIPPRFKDLIAPFQPDDILTLWSDRQLGFRRGSNADRFATLVDWKTAHKLIVDEVIPLDKFSVTYNRRIVPPLFYGDNGKFSPERFARLLEQGSSIRILSLEKYVPAISAACLDARTHNILLSQVSVVVTTGRGGSFPNHFDPYDLIVLQVEGCKRWRIYGPPVMDLKAKPKPEPPQAAPLFDAVLEPGDILALPAGYWHICDNASERSLHLALISKPVSSRTIAERATIDLAQPGDGAETQASEGSPGS